MIHSTRIERQREFEYAGTNQHGDRYRIKEYKNTVVLNLFVKHSNTKEEVWELMAICSSLGVAPTWNVINDEQRMSIEVVAKKSVM